MIVKHQTKLTKTTLPILKYGNPILRKKVEDVIDFDNLSDLVQNMFITMYQEKGIGLAANQVGRSINLIIVDTTNIEGEDDSEPYVFINSKIIKTNGSIVMEEGCLSVPEIRAEIERPETITLQYQDLQKKVHEIKFSNIISRVIQHEIDHLEGKFFVDYLSPSKRILIHKRLLEISANGTPTTGIIL